MVECLLTVQCTKQHVRYFISRGDLMNSGTDGSGSKDSSKNGDDAENSLDDSKIDGDLTNLLNQIKEGNQLSDPFSPTNQDSKPDKNKDQNQSSQDISKRNRHWQFCYHFPLPQDENSTHDCNQRNGK